jgi:UDP-MurNAc hydroxylase
MKVTCVGHAGLLIETTGGRILCDPWFGPAYYAGWFPFPDNAWLRSEPALRKPDYLYVSHSHPDHFDRAFCAEVDKTAIVVLPDYPLDELEQALRALGFTRFLKTRHGVPEQLPHGLTLTVLTDVSPMDGPMGDSALIVDDGQTRVFNRNDARPRDLAAIEAHGPYDAHFGQHSGAAWFPVIYQLPPAAKRVMGQRKRRNQLDRFLRYDEVAQSGFSVPNSGPPCFLDAGMLWMNDLGTDPGNVYPDQLFALDALGERGRLMLPGSTAMVFSGIFDVQHEMDPAAVFGAGKASHLFALSKREAPVIADTFERLIAVPDLFEALMELLVPLVARADRIAAGVGGNVVVDWGEEAIVLDFARREVRRWADEPYIVRHIYERSILGDMVATGMENWVDDVWSGCRLQAHRRGPYNDYVNAFFRCLSPERLDYAEAWCVERDGLGEHEFWMVDGYRIQRYCPHMRGDLSRVGRVEDGIVTCAVHGMRFDLETGVCLDTEGLTLRTEKVTTSTAPTGFR